MFFLRMFKVIGCLIILVWVLFSLLGALVFLLLASYDDRRTPDDFVLIVKPHAFRAADSNTLQERAAVIQKAATFLSTHTWFIPWVAKF